MMEKVRFNPTIETRGIEGILEILEKTLRGEAAFTRCEFRQNKEEDLIFTTVFNLFIYPFKWEFFLTKMDDNEIFDLLVTDIIAPMASTI